MPSDNQTPVANISYLKDKETDEPIAGFLGMRLIDLSPGFARVAMTMKPDYINFNGMVFGGIVMSLADQAFAYATNSLLMPNL